MQYLYLLCITLRSICGAMRAKRKAAAGDTEGKRREGKGRNLFVLITENTTCTDGKGKRPTLLYATRPPSYHLP